LTNVSKVNNFLYENLSKDHTCTDKRIQDKGLYVGSVYKSDI